MKVIVCLPYLSTAPRHHGTASEVATVEFLRLQGVAFPKVFDWSSSTSNQVSSEYIITEEDPGRELEDTWYTITVQERMKIVEKIVDIEKILFAIQFPADGSLYFKVSLEENIITVSIPPNADCGETDRACIRPSTELLCWYQKRDELTINRGPCKKPLALRYLKSV